MGKILSHVRQHAVGYVALFFAVTGTAAAATPIITNSTQIADHVVTPAKLVTDPTHTFAYTGAFTFVETACNSSEECEWRDGAVTSLKQTTPSLAGAYIDGDGTVHLKGTVCFTVRYTFQTAGSGKCSTAENNDPHTFAILQLPAGYRPARDEAFPQPQSTDGDNVVVKSNGQVVSDSDSPVADLDGITFRAGN